MSSEQSVGDTIRNARASLEMSREELAKEIGVHPRTVTRWEDGTSTPGRRGRKALNDELGLDLPIRTARDADGQDRSVELEEALLHRGEAWADLEVYRIRQGITRPAMARLIDISEGIYRSWVRKRIKAVPTERSQQAIEAETGILIAVGTLHANQGNRLCDMPPWKESKPGERAKWLRLVLCLSARAVAHSAGITEANLNTIEHRGSERAASVPLHAMGFPAYALDEDTLDGALRTRGKS